MQKYCFFLNYARKKEKNRPKLSDFSLFDGFGGLLSASLTLRSSNDV
jgi:hypothetical protein